MSSVEVEANLPQQPAATLHTHRKKKRRSRGKELLDKAHSKDREEKVNASPSYAAPTASSRAAARPFTSDGVQLQLAEAQAAIAISGVQPRVKQTKLFSHTIDASSVIPVTTSRGVDAIPDSVLEHSAYEPSYSQKLTLTYNDNDETKESTIPYQSVVGESHPRSPRSPAHVITPSLSRPSTSPLATSPKSSPSNAVRSLETGISSRVDSHRADPAFDDEVDHLLKQPKPVSSVSVPGPNAAQLATRIQQVAILSLKRPVTAEQMPAHSTATLSPQQGNLRKHRRGIIGPGTAAVTNLNHATASGGGSRGSVLLRADALAELSNRSKVESTSETESMAFRHSFLFSGNQKAIEAALKKRRDEEGRSDSDDSSDDDVGGDDIRAELTTGIGFSVRRESEAPKLHPASKQLIRLDPSTIAADHNSLHAHLTTHDPIIATQDLAVVEQWLTEMSVKFQRKMEGDQSFNNTSSAVHNNPNSADASNQNASNMATATAGDYQSPLDKTGLGRRILEKAGMSLDLTNRCYIGCFTYSIGFYDCILAMCKHVSQRKKFMNTIWKVYLNNLETSEADMYEWVIECVRTENARREDLKRQEHQHRIQVLKQHTKHLKKKVRIMSINDAALKQLQEGESTSMKNLGTNLREMQHEYEMSVEAKSHVHSSIAEWTMNSFEMEAAVHHLQESRSNMLDERKKFIADLTALEKHVFVLNQTIVEEKGRKALLQTEHDTLLNTVGVLETDVLHKEQHLQHLLDNASVYKKLMQEEEIRVRELEDIIQAQESYMDHLVESGLHSNLSAEAQQESLRKAMWEAARSRTNRPAVAGIENSATARYRVLNAHAQLENQAAGDNGLDTLPDGFDPTTGAMTADEISKRGMDSQIAEMKLLKQESQDKIEEFKLQQVMLKEEIELEEKILNETLTLVRGVESQAEILKQSRDDCEKTLLEYESTHHQLVNTNLKSLQKRLEELNKKILLHEIEIGKRQKRLEAKRSKLAEILHKITDLSKLEEQCNTQIKELNLEQTQHMEAKVQLELLVEALSKTLAKKARHYELLQEESAPLFTNYNNRLAILKKELELHEKERQLLEGMMLQELKIKKAKEDLLQSIQTKIEAAKQAYEKSIQTNNELNLQMLTDTEVSHQENEEISQIHDLIDKEQAQSVHFDEICAKEIQEMEQKCAMETAHVAVETKMCEEVKEELEAARKLNAQVADAHSRKIHDAKFALTLKEKEMDAKKYKKEQEKESIRYANQSLKVQYDATHSKTKLIDSDHEFLHSQIENVNNEVFQVLMQQKLRTKETLAEDKITEELSTRIPYLKMQLNQLVQSRKDEESAIETRINVELEKQKALMVDIVEFESKEVVSNMARLHRAAQAGAENSHALWEAITLKLPPKVRAKGFVAERVIIPSARVWEAAVRRENQRATPNQRPLTSHHHSPSPQKLTSLMPSQFKVQAQLADAQKQAGLLAAAAAKKQTEVAREPQLAAGNDLLPASPPEHVRRSSESQTSPISSPRTMLSPRTAHLRRLQLRLAGEEPTLSHSSSDSVIVDPQLSKVLTKQLNDEIEKESEPDYDSDASYSDSPSRSTTHLRIQAAGDNGETIELEAAHELHYSESLENLLESPKNVQYIYVKDGEDAEVREGDELIEESIDATTLAQVQAAQAHSSAAPSSRVPEPSTRSRRFIRRKLPDGAKAPHLDPNSPPQIDTVTGEQLPLSPTSTQVKVFRFQPTFFGKKSVVEQSPVRTSMARSGSFSNTSSPSLSPAFRPMVPKNTPGSLLLGDHPDIVAMNQRQQAANRASEVNQPNVADVLNPLIRRIRFPDAQLASQQASAANDAEEEARAKALAALPLTPFFIVNKLDSPSSRPPSRTSRTRSAASTPEPKQKRKLSFAQKRIARAGQPVKSPKAPVTIGTGSGVGLPKLSKILKAQKLAQLQADFVAAAKAAQERENNELQRSSVELKVNVNSEVIKPQKARADNLHINGWKAKQLKERFQKRHALWQQKQRERAERRAARERKRDEFLSQGLGPEHDTLGELASSDESTEPEPHLSSEEELHDMEEILNPSWKQSFNPQETLARASSLRRSGSLTADDSDDYSPFGRRSSTETGSGTFFRRKSALMMAVDSAKADAKQAAVRAEKEAARLAKRAARRQENMSWSEKALMGAIEAADAAGVKSPAEQLWDAAWAKHEEKMKRLAESGQAPTFQDQLEGQAILEAKQMATADGLPKVEENKIDPAHAEIIASMTKISEQAESIVDTSAAASEIGTPTTVKKKVDKKRLTEEKKKRQEEARLARTSFLRNDLKQMVYSSDEEDEVSKDKKGNKSGQSTAAPTPRSKRSRQPSTQIATEAAVNIVAEATTEVTVVSKEPTPKSEGTEKKPSTKNVKGTKSKLSPVTTAVNAVAKLKNKRGSMMTPETGATQSPSNKRRSADSIPAAASSREQKVSPLTSPKAERKLTLKVPSAASSPITSPSGSLKKIKSPTASAANLLQSPTGSKKSLASSPALAMAKSPSGSQHSTVATPTATQQSTAPTPTAAPSNAVSGAQSTKAGSEEKAADAQETTEATQEEEEEQDEVDDEEEGEEEERPMTLREQRAAVANISSMSFNIHGSTEADMALMLNEKMTEKRARRQSAAKKEEMRLATEKVLAEKEAFRRENEEANEMIGDVAQALTAAEVAALAIEKATHKRSNSRRGHSRRPSKVDSRPGSPSLNRGKSEDGTPKGHFRKMSVSKPHVESGLSKTVVTKPLVVAIEQPAPATIVSPTSILKKPGTAAPAAKKVDVVESPAVQPTSVVASHTTEAPAPSTTIVESPKHTTPASPTNPEKMRTVQFAASLFAENATRAKQTHVVAPVVSPKAVIPPKPTQVTDSTIAKMDLSGWSTSANDMSTETTLPTGIDDLAQEEKQPSVPETIPAVAAVTPTSVRAQAAAEEKHRREAAAIPSSSKRTARRQQPPMSLLEKIAQRAASSSWSPPSVSSAIRNAQRGRKAPSPDPRVEQYAEQLMKENDADKSYHSHPSHSHSHAGHTTASASSGDNSVGSAMATAIQQPITVLPSVVGASHRSPKRSKSPYSNLMRNQMPQSVRKPQPPPTKPGETFMSPSASVLAAMQTHTPVPSTPGGFVPPPPLNVTASPSYRIIPAPLPSPPMSSRPALKVSRRIYEHDDGEDLSGSYVAVDNNSHNNNVQSPSAMILFDDKFFERTHKAAVEEAQRENARIQFLQFQAAQARAALAAAEEALNQANIVNLPPASAAVSRPRSRGRSRAHSRSASRGRLTDESDGEDVTRGWTSGSNASSRGGSRQISPTRGELLYTSTDNPHAFNDVVVQGLPPVLNSAKGLYSSFHAPEKEAPDFSLSEPHNLAWNVALKRRSLDELPTTGPALHASNSQRRKFAASVRENDLSSFLPAPLFRPTTAPDNLPPSGSQSARTFASTSTNIMPPLMGVQGVSVNSAASPSATAGWSTSRVQTASSSSRPVSSWNDTRPVSRSRFGAMSVLSGRSSSLSARGLKHFFGENRVPEFVKRKLVDRAHESKEAH